MNFNASQWRRTYDRVQNLGMILQDSEPRMDESGEWIPPVHEISKEAKKAIENEIQNLLISNNLHLDLCEMKPNPRLWRYSNKDETTWESSETFEYGHLVKPIPKWVTIRWCDV